MVGMATLLSYYALTLPFGYWLVSRAYPEDTLSWGELLVVFALILIWPLTGLAMLATKLDVD